MGRRGLVLLLVAAWEAVYGASLRLDGHSATSAHLSALTDVAPLGDWAWAWIGSAPLVAAFAPRRAGNDAYGFVLATLPLWIWVAAYVASWARGSYPLGWVTALSWGLDAALILACGAAVSRSDLPPASPLTAQEMERTDADGQ